MAKQQSAPAPPGQANIIQQGTVLEGTVRSNGDVHISGKVIGRVEVKGKTVIMPGGEVEGEIDSGSARIGGRVKGEVTVRERLELNNSAVVEGDIITKKLIIEDGATFTGSCDMGGGSGRSGSTSDGSSSSSAGGASGSPSASKPAGVPSTAGASASRP
jgi:cytoskeletal protein CcmA (bactofilin family)